MMPYFVYRKTPDNQVEILAVHDKYKEAKQAVTELRVKREAAGDDDILRMVFAKDKREAKRLISVKRELSSPVEEWEEKL
jgi:hypothetical protein